MKKNLFKLVVLAFIFGAITLNTYAQETKVTKTIKVLDFLDQAVIDANQAKGGLQTVATVANLSDGTIKSSRVSLGMLVVVTGTKDVYRLDVLPATTAANWTKLASIPTFVASKAYTVGDLIFEGGKFYIAKKAFTAAAAFASTDWRELGTTKIKTFATLTDPLFSNLGSDSLKTGDISFITDIRTSIGGAQKGVLIRNSANSGWDTITIEKPTILEGKVYHGVGGDATLDETKVLALGTSATATTFAFSENPTFSGTAKYFSFAYPADFPGNPAVYVTAYSNTSQLTDCWSVYNVTVEGRDYRVWTTNVSFELALGALTFSVK